MKRFIIAMLSGVIATDACAFYAPAQGRWLSRDPIAEPGFTLLGNRGQPTSEATAEDESMSADAEQFGGEGVYVFSANDAVRFIDLLGLRWKVDRRGGVRAPAEPEAGDTVADLAGLIGLDAGDYRKWLTPIGTTSMPGSSDQGLAACDRFEIPNTVVAYWAGNAGRLGRWWIRWNASVKYLAELGFNVDEHRHRAGQRMALRDILISRVEERTLHGLYFWGHGNTAFLVSRSGDELVEYATLGLSYKMGLGLVFACESDSGVGFLLSGTPGSIWRGFPGLLIPWPFRYYHPKHYIHHGEQETH